jgi:G3E family GTPase
VFVAVPGTNCNSDYNIFRGDFERILHELSEKRILSHKNGIEAPFDYVIIETTGLADPIFIQSFFQDEHIKENFYLDGIVTLIGEN